MTDRAYSPAHRWAVRLLGLVVFVAIAWLASACLEAGSVVPGTYPLSLVCCGVLLFIGYGLFAEAWR